MTLTYRNGVSIAEIVVYVPCLATAIFLAIRHGFGRSSGWYFLIVLCLVRIIGPCMQLATISDPTNTSLYTGVSILQNVALSPLQLATLGLLSRLIESINKTHSSVIKTPMLKVVELLVLVGLILGINGGIKASDNYTNTGIYQVSPLTKAGTALFTVSFVFIVVASLATSFSVPHAEPGEKRIMMAIAISLPFLLVRLIYSIISTFGHFKSFSLLTGSTTVLLCLAIIEEFVIVVVYEAVGLTLQKASKIQHVEEQPETQGSHHHVPSNDSRNYQVPAPKQNIALRIAKKSIIGQIVMAFIPNKKDRDVQMEQHEPLQK